MKSKMNIPKTLSNIGISIMLPVAIFITFVLLTGGKFANANLLLSVAKQMIIPMLIAISMSMQMTMNMWNLSGGSIIYAGAIFGGSIAVATGTGLIGLVVVSIITAILFSVISGVLYNVMKIPSMVFSIGITMIYEVIPRLVFKNGTAEVPMSWGMLSQPPWCFIIFGLMFVLFYVVYNKTILGHNVRAIGANQSVAYSAGVNVAKIKLIAAIFSGLFLGVAGALFMSSGIRVYAASGMSSVAVIFDAMMGIFIAFVLTRYSGFSMGLLIGVFTMRLLGTGLVSFGLSSTARSICSGLFLLVILCYAANQGRFSAWKERRKIAIAADEAYKLGTNF